MNTKFIILDDDSCYNTISILSLKKLIPVLDADIISFTDPTEGLEYLANSFAAAPQKAILFLDINMPRLNGWEVIRRIEKMPDSTRRYLTVYILSTYLNANDIMKAEQHLLVQDVLEKPLINHISYIIERANSSVASEVNGRFCKDYKGLV